jgi:hypothetical protein
MASPLSGPVPDYTRDAIFVDSPMRMSNLPPCPVNHENRNLWTETQRQKASEGVRVTNIQHLQEKVEFSLSERYSF